MQVTILKPVEVKLEGTMRALADCTKLNLPADKAQKLIDAGYAEPVCLLEECRRTLQDFTTRVSNADCWPWVAKNLPDLLREHFGAFRACDFDKARSTFDDMVKAWEGRHDQQQPELLAV